MILTSMLYAKYTESRLPSRRMNARHSNRNRKNRNRKSEISFHSVTPRYKLERA